MFLVYRFSSIIYPFFVKKTFYCKFKVFFCSIPVLCVAHKKFKLLKVKERPILWSKEPRIAATGGVLRNFANFTQKHLCQSLFFKKETLAQVFSCEFYEISKNTFFTEHPWTTDSQPRIIPKKSIWSFHERNYKSLLVRITTLQDILKKLFSHQNSETGFAESSES